jgi:hypothetical protein
VERGRIALAEAVEQVFEVRVGRRESWREAIVDAEIGGRLRRDRLVEETDR